MHLQLLHQNEPVTELIDYTCGIITRHYKVDGAKYCFTLHPEHYSEGEALAPTGRYLAVLLTPSGIRAFYLLKNIKGKYDVDDTSEEVNLEHFKNGHGYITMYAQVLLSELNEKMIFIKACLKIMNQAIAEFIP